VRLLQNAGTEVVDAKAGGGSATLSMAYAAFLFATACIKALNGFAGIVECAYIEDSSVEGCDFFAQRVKLGRTGITQRYGIGKLSDSEKAALDAMRGQLKDEIQKGKDWGPSAAAPAPA
jgi:malate dehydrogenase